MLSYCKYNTSNSTVAGWEFAHGSTHWPQASRALDLKRLIFHAPIMLNLIIITILVVILPILFQFTIPITASASANCHT